MLSLFINVLHINLYHITFIYLYISIMAKRYGTWKRKFKDSSGREKELYYACSRRGNIIGFKELSEVITESTSLTPGDLGSALITLNRYLKLYLSIDYSVKLSGIGSFSVAVTSDGFENPEDITPDKVRASKIVYTPDRDLVEFLKTLEFENFDKKIEKRIGKGNPLK